jgi:DNA transposition AAA+ family ATPase
MLYYIKAKVSIKVYGISGTSQEGVSKLVNANSEKDALHKFENFCSKKFAKMEPEKLSYDWLEIAGEI